MGLPIAHRDGDLAVLDALREIKAPFNPRAAVAELAPVLKAYRIARLVGDFYGGEWPSERFREAGFEYQRSEKTKSELYAALLPTLNCGQVQLLDVPRLKSQLMALERRTARSGRDSIDHPPRSRDDLINAAAGALVLARESLAVMSPEQVEAWRATLAELQKEPLEMPRWGGTEWSAKDY